MRSVPPTFGAKKSQRRGQNYKKRKKGSIFLHSLEKSACLFILVVLKYQAVQSAKAEISMCVDSRQGAVCSRFAED